MPASIPEEEAMARSRSTRTRTRWLAAAVVLAVALAVGGPYVYINLVQGDTPDRLYAATEQAAADTTTGGANGELTVHGTTKAVTVQVTVKRSGDGFSVSGSVPVTFADYSIPNPSFGPVTTEDNGEIEFLLALTRA
jgi:hypothetical protein